jgi:hypothetical protein
MRPFPCVTLAALAALLLAFSGCPKTDDTADTESDSDADVDADSDTDSDGDTDVTFVPQEGEWLITLGGATKNTCEDGPEKGKEIVVVLAMQSDTAFTLDNGKSVQQCTLTNMSFACDPVVQVLKKPAKIDAVVIRTDTVVGGFQSPTVNGGNSTTEVTCEGKDCYLVEKGHSIPCVVLVPFMGTAADS